MEESEPTFAHTPAEQLASFTDQGAEVRLLVGEAFGRRSPVKAASPTLFLSVRLNSRDAFVLPALAPELAIYPLSDGVTVDGSALAVHTLGVLANGQAAGSNPRCDCTVVVIGGAPLDGRRFLLWNFVSSTKLRLQRAAEDWRAQRMGAVPGESRIHTPARESVDLAGGRRCITRVRYRTPHD